MIDAVGANDFTDILMDYTAQAFGAESCIFVELSAERPKTIGLSSLQGKRHAREGYSPYVEGQHWKIDPGIKIANSHLGNSDPILLHMPRDELDPCLATEIYRSEVVDRLLFAGYAQSRPILLGLFRTPGRGKFHDADVAHLCHVGASLISAIAKHAMLLDKTDHLLRSLTRKEVIEENIRQADEGLPRREVEVCARILAGLSVEGIALDLNVGLETVTTYRKRAYGRLGLANRYDLFLWYIRSISGLEAISGPIARLAHPGN
ncbi:helix-turn-helix transcriptional regulator [Rhizorhabdus wittichii]|uniref:Helix-turn-helix transcriptional regulator n=1 Tax=Rhizorhabdus wittichii TaxID=160791 RepID=A0A975HDQ9_9SPHN|nr:helix-turn-helix transcriptional regulator [Rhizorhabdus wittichii]